MRYLKRGTSVFGGACGIVHLVHVAIPAPHFGGVLESSLWGDLLCIPVGEFS